MSDFFKKMKSVFVESSATEGDAGQTETTDAGNDTAPTTKSSPESTSGPATVRPSAEINVSGQQSDQFYKVLFDALERNNQAGFDYLEFKKALQSLESLGLDEKTRFISAFAGAQASGASTQNLTDSATIYLEILDTEATNFRNAVEAQRTKQISNRENEAKQLNNLLAGKMDQIQKLQTEIEEHKKMLSSLDEEIKSAQSKIETTKADFSVTYESLVRKIRDDVDRIKTYLTTK